MHTGADCSKQSFGPSLTPESTLSCPVATHISSSLSPSLSVSEPHLIQCAAHILSQHAIILAKAWSRPPGAIRKMYPFILQDTHLAYNGAPKELYRKVMFPCDNNLPA